MKINLLLILSIGLLFSQCKSQEQEEEQKKPNVLFIAIDDLNDYVGSMNGSIKAYTPNIDRLASMGALFTNAHCQAPICAPSRASIMTGLYPSSSGNYLQVEDQFIKSGSPKVAESTFMPDYFEKHGYKTYGVGKIYHGGDMAKSFDEFGGWFSWFGPKPKERMNYDPSKMPEKVGGTQTDWGAFPEYDSSMTDYKVAEYAVSKLQETHDSPFFLAAGFLRPHVPWHVPQKWFDMFPLDKIELPPYKADDYDDIPQMSKEVNDAPQMPTAEGLMERGEWKEVIQAYLACTAFADAQLGKILDALEQSPYADNTIVVLWSDHGHHLGEKNRVAKQSLWERSTRVPLVIKIPNQEKGRKCDKPVQLLDLYPTLLDLCQLPAYELAEGKSLKSLVLNPESDWQHKALTMYGKGNIAIRGERYRLIQYEDGSQELYDMQEDPNEWTNLATDDTYKDIIVELQQNIPANWEALSEHSKYGFNSYFKSK